MSTFSRTAMSNLPGRRCGRPPGGPRASLELTTLLHPTGHGQGPLLVGEWAAVDFERVPLQEPLAVLLGDGEDRDMFPQAPVRAKLLVGAQGRRQRVVVERAAAHLPGLRHRDFKFRNQRDL